jgi:ubiquitin C-terminal hydrolase
MTNLNNTCYFNSGWQVLAHAKSFVEAVRGVDGANKALQTTQAFKQFIESQCEHSKTAINPAEFFARFTQLDAEYFQLGKQQDSLDAVNRGLEALDDELSAQISNPAELFKFLVIYIKMQPAIIVHTSIKILITSG